MKKIIVLLILLFFSFTALAATCESVAAATNLNVTADFSATPMSGAAPLSVQFTDNSKVNSGGSITSWKWDFGDGYTSSLKSPSHTYNAAGVYTATLIASNSGGSSQPKSATITVTNTLKPPVAAFSASPTSGNPPLTVTFTDQSTESPTSWSWNFGDGTTSTIQGPTHTYSSAGVYTVTLIASNSDGSSAPKTATITVTEALKPPVAAFSAAPTTGTPPLTVTFTDQSIGLPTSWSWNFGDGTNSNVQNPTHTYYGVGTYTVSLIATNSGGSNSSSSIVNVTAVPSIVANFSSNISSGIAPLTVQFNDHSTGNPTTWNWNFGDGATSTEQNPIHTYSKTNTYTVILIVGNANSWNTVTNFITVGNGLLAAFTATPNQGEVPLTVQFTDASIGAPTAWLWDFGDGNNSTLQNPSHTYTQAGSFNVKLTVSNNVINNTSQIPFLINVSSVNTLAANFNSNLTSGNTPLTVQFNDLSTGNPAAWYWDFGDGTNSTDKNPIHTYSETGSYSVTLNVSNATRQSTLTLPDYIVVTDDSGDSSSGGGSSSSSSSTGTGSLGSSSPEPTSNIAVKLQEQRYIAAGNHIKFEFAKNATCIDCVEFDAKKTLGKITTTIEQLKDRSVLTPTDPEGKVYKYVNIWVGNNGIAIPGNIENATVSFILSKDEIKMNESENNSTVILQRYDQGEWEPLNTIKTGEDAQYVYYKADTSGFSSFAITSGETNLIAENSSQPGEGNASKSNNPYNGELSTQSKQPMNTTANNTDWQKYSSVIRFFVLFIVLLFIGLAIREKRK